MARLIDQVIGHREQWTNLLTQMAAQHLPHALALSGPAGIGKRRVAWALAQALVCEGTDRPCGVCPPCQRVEKQQSESVMYVEPVKGTIKLESAQQILQFLNLQRLGRARVVIMDGAQNLNPQAANALLKIVEEPPEQTYFILLVNAWSQLLPTLRSRLQVWRFSPLSDSELQSEESPEWMIRSARGSFAQLETFRDADSDDVRRLTFSFLQGALTGQREALDALMDRCKERELLVRAIGFLQQFLRDWTLLDVGVLIHADLRAQLAALREVAPALRVALWRKAFQLEQDANLHVDRTLLLENFFYWAQNPAAAL